MSKLYEAAIGGLRGQGFTDEQISRELELPPEVIAEYPGETASLRCGNCGTEHEAEVGQCSQCGRIFSGLAQPFESGATTADWRASVARSAQTERANEQAVKRGGEVSVPSDYLNDLKTALAGVRSPSEQTEGT